MILLLTGTSAAANATTARTTALAAWDCPVGDLCVWSGYDGTGSRCNWANADNDWMNAPVTCSWSGYNKVKSIYNRGQSTSFLGVMLYKNTNYPSNAIWDCIAQGSKMSFISGISDGVYLASHRWTNSWPYC
ncbi:peptidase inhibitor family I36 protein [Catellatospora vulcania]|uniref:peptidase inhibitor family I36 protein n=1 Tax=Catellatospora vulcania TaxID=1460450 RepID=UPI0018AFDFF5|nr:peptidase inhibitor family I36 protein [Catellatospora vulcania]